MRTSTDIRIFFRHLFIASAMALIFSCAGGSAGDVNRATAPDDSSVMRDPSAVTEEKSLARDELDAKKDMESDGHEGAVSGKEDSTKNGDGAPETSIEAARRLSLREDGLARAPEMLARLDKPDMESLPFAAHDISVVIFGHRARVVFDMVFENPTANTLAGTLMVELPQGASPCYLGMFQGALIKEAGKDSALSLLNPKPPAVEKLLEKTILPSGSWQAPGGMVDWGELRAARVVNPVQGREVYEKVTRRRVDPALAEWAGGNNFTTRIFPIPPKSHKRVVFAYDRPLEFSGGGLLFPLPLPAVVKARTRLFVHLLSDGRVKGRLLQAEKEIKPQTAAYGSFWQITADQNQNGSVVFQGTLNSKTVSALEGSDEAVPGKLVHLLYAPNVKAQAAAKETGKAVILLDTSLSSKDKLFARSGALLKRILDSDASIKEFAVLAFDVRPRLFTKGFVANTPSHRAALYGSLEGLWLEGATDFSGALEYIAADQSLAAGDAYFLLSDGLITWGNENPVELKNGFPELLAKRWICYGFGDEAVNRALFSELTRAGGQFVQAGVEQDLAKAALAHRFAPATLDSLYGSAQEEVLVSGDPRLLYPGQVLEIACRARGQGTSLTLIAVIDGRKETITVEAKENKTSSAAAARAWAEVYCNRLLDLYDVKANQAVLALSQRFSLTNREASFIILETDAEYAEHKIDASALDLKELTRLARERKTRFPFGAPEADDLPEAALALVASFKNLPAVSVWETQAVPELVGGVDVFVFPAGAKRPKETPVALYTWAQELYQGAGRKDARRLEQALRALSSIVELKPRDDAALRLVGYALLEWSLYGEAEDLFRLVRQRRPFEPQNYLLEGLALAVRGRASDAALRFEILLRRSFPRMGEFTAPVAAVLYAQLLQAIVKNAPGTPAASGAAKRLTELGAPSAPRGRLLLFWNLDDTDVDLHVREPGGEEVAYDHPTSVSGGKLFWDNTSGLGPELYEHPVLHQTGFEVFVNYFGSSAVEGAAPSATLVGAFTRRAQGKPEELRFHTTALVGTREDKVLIMPRWKP